MTQVIIQKKKTQQKNNQKLAAQIKPTYYCRANNESHLNCNCLQDNVLYQATVKISRQWRGNMYKSNRRKLETAKKKHIVNTRTAQWFIIIYKKF